MSRGENDKLHVLVTCIAAETVLVTTRYMASDIRAIINVMKIKIHTLQLNFTDSIALTICNKISNFTHLCAMDMLNQTMKYIFLQYSPTGVKVF
jgi:hypothetical protein